MNEEDSEQIALYMESMGYQPVADAEKADVVLLNTCSVRAKPEEKVWSELGRLRDIKRDRPDMVIGVCGCMAQVESVEIKRRAPHVDMVVGTGNISAIPEMVRRVKSGEVVLEEEKRRKGEEENGKEACTSHPSSLIPYPYFLLTVAGQNANDHADRAAIAAAQGRDCGGYSGPRCGAQGQIEGACADYVRLRQVLHVLHRAAHAGTRTQPPDRRGSGGNRGLARNGTREITLLGQTVNSYGKNLPEGRVPFAQLLEQINAIRGIQRIRFTSPYPRDFTDELIEAIGRLEHVCEHVHLPLQVGDDELLLEMHRGYTVARYREIVDNLRARVPGIAITTDMMLGYPGETDEQVANTMRMVEEIRFDSAFMFAYSPRPNTKAAAMENQVPQKVKIERLNALIARQNQITVEINQAQVGQVFEVLVEGRSQRDPNRLSGYTRTQKMVNFTVPAGGTRSLDSLIGKLVPVRALEANLTGFTGELAD